MTHWRRRRPPPTQTARSSTGGSGGGEGGGRVRSQGWRVGSRAAAAIAPESALLARYACVHASVQAGRRHRPPPSSNLVVDRLAHQLQLPASKGGEAAAVAGAHACGGVSVAGGARISHALAAAPIAQREDHHPRSRRHRTPSCRMGGQPHQSAAAALAHHAYVTLPPSPSLSPICSSKLCCQGWARGSTARALSVASPTTDEAANSPIT